MAFVLKNKSDSQKPAAAREVTGLAGFNLNDLADEGRSRVEQCRAEVRRMIVEAEEQAKVIRAQAEQQGYQDGSLRAAADADAKLQREAEIRAKESLELIRQAVEQLHAAHESWMRQYSDALVTTALAAAERIVMRKLDEEPELLVRWAADAVESTRAACNLTVAVHPETLAQLGDQFDRLLASPDLPEQTQVAPDESVARQGVIVRQNGGSINAGLAAQLERLAEMLT